MSARRIPSATYRVQLGADFTFTDTIGILDQLRALGISHLYLSPICAAMPGSTHGYDWLPPARVAPLLGGVEGLRALRSAASRLGIGIIIDIVPNHVGVADALANPWFADVLRHGVDSPFARFFDLDLAADNGADGKIALPVLAADGDLGPLAITADGVLTYHEHRFPTAPGTLGGSPADVHARQHYRLVAWDSGRIGYRRFFTVNELAGLRQEDPEVYAATHSWLHELIAEDLIDGVRVDHPDGLWDPQEYLRRLRADVGPDRLIYIEKILAPDEALEPTLPVAGTTGYDQLRVIDAVFVAPTGAIELAEIHERITGTPGDGHAITAGEHDRKLATLAGSFTAEHRRLIRTLQADSPHPHPAVTDEAYSRATAALIAALGVYRADYPSLRPRLIAVADRLAAESPGLAAALRQVVEQTADLGPPSARLAQVCGAVTAKSVEDSLFYRTARLVSAQEVGSDPAEPALSLNAFHTHNAERAALLPLAMTATSTHDTKRGEDVRARIAILSQVPERWSLLVDEIWRVTTVPDDLTCYFLLQNIVGVWPPDGRVTEELRDRLQAYARKAIREAGRHTSWTAVDADFETAVADWSAAVTTGPAAAAIDGFVARILPVWRQEALARKAIAILAPGVPDIYQGTQYWEDSLVDPDNRRPVDHRRAPDPKTELISECLRVRGTHPDAFGVGATYRGLPVAGPAADHVVAFVRGDRDGDRVVVITARFTHSLDEQRAAATRITLPAGRWSRRPDRANVDPAVHTESIELATARAHGPVTILEPAD